MVMFDLVFTCPPYYKVEKYLDYDGKPPAGEINSLATYEQFRDTLFAGYTKAIEHLNDGCFFVVMTGDSRDGKGAYHCSEAETELFLKAQGLSIYNRIVYLEGEFTRLAQAKVTLNTRKFPKREQKIISRVQGRYRRDQHSLRKDREIVMSLTPEQRQDYMRAVLDEFLDRWRPDRFTPSSVEMELARKWALRGVPLATILEGIRQTGGKPRTLMACSRAVEENIARWHAAVGGLSSLPDAGPLE